MSNDIAKIIKDTAEATKIADAHYLTYLSQIANAISRTKGFHDGFEEASDYEQMLRIGYAITLMHAELSEAVEELRVPEVRKDKHLPEHDAFETELADVVIRVFDLCGLLNIDLGRIVADKMAFNASRPWKHGKSI